MNKWKQLQDLMPKDITIIGQVTAHNSDGTSNILTSQGVLIKAEGQNVPTLTNAFVENGRVVGQAPTLPIYTLNI